MKRILKELVIYFIINKWDFVHILYANFKVFITLNLIIYKFIL